MNIFAQNRDTRNYKILEKIEAGIVLSGFEVKSVKNGLISLNGSRVIIRQSNAFLIGANISPFQPQNTPSNFDSNRTKKLLLKKSEIKELIGKSSSGLTIIPLKVYSKGVRIKIEIALARSLKKFEKREKIKEKEVKRQIRELKWSV